MTASLNWKTREFPLPKDAVGVTLQYERESNMVRIMWGIAKEKDIL